MPKIALFPPGSAGKQKPRGKAFRILLVKEVWNLSYSRQALKPASGFYFGETEENAPRIYIDK